MSQGGGQKQTKLSYLQRGLILWIASAMDQIPGVKVPGLIKLYLETKIEDQKHAIEALQQETLETEAISEKFEAGLLDVEKKDELLKLLRSSRVERSSRGVPWNLPQILGRSPTPSESVRISNSLARLEKRGLVKRSRSGVKGKHTSHVKLTKKGLEALPQVIQKEREPGGWFDELDEIAKKRVTVNNRPEESEKELERASNS